MSQSSAIEWTDTTWNPIRGCTKVSPGCANCYAETFAERWRGVPCHAYEQGFDLRMAPHKLDEPLQWRKPRRVFVNSMSDLFQEGVPDEYIDRVFAVMALAKQHTFQVLTKRPARMLAYCKTLGRHNSVDRVSLACREFVVGGSFMWSLGSSGWHLPNVWLGVSVENQHFADERIPLLLETPAAVRFISAEPLLGAVDVEQYVQNRRTIHVSADVEGMLLNRSFDGLTDKGKPLTRSEAERGLRELLANGVKRIKASDDCIGFSDQTGCPGHRQTRLDWVIVGGESGPGARPFDVAWARSIVHQCKAAGVPAFVKQLGALPIQNEDEWRVGDGNGRVSLLSANNHKRTPSGFVPIAQLSRKGGDMAEWPSDLRVREFPAIATA